MFERVDFYAYIENRFTFAIVVATKTEDWILNSNPSGRFHFKTFLVPVPFPVVTTFETAGKYKKWQWPNSADITYAWYARF